MLKIVLILLVSAMMLVDYSSPMSIPFDSPKIVGRFKREKEDVADFNVNLSSIKLNTRTGLSCGGYYVFAQICKNSGDSEYCCEDELVQNGDDGFNAGDTIEAQFNNCTEFEFSADDKDNLSIKLTSWNEETKESGVFLPRGFRNTFPNWKIHSIIS